jgi:hypothetical protein
VIRDCVIHLLNEQPLLADLIDVPSPGDVALLCTNLRMKNQSRPIFVDHIGSTFVFPYTQVRFVEIPRAAEAGPEAPAAPALAAGMPEEEIELDEELLRRVREL